MTHCGPARAVIIGGAVRWCRVCSGSIHLTTYLAPIAQAMIMWN